MYDRKEKLIRRLSGTVNYFVEHSFSHWIRVNGSGQRDNSTP